MQAGEKDTRSIRYVHQSGEVVIGISELGASLEASMGGEPLRVLPVADWVAEVEKAGMDPLLVSYLRKMASGGGQMTFPRLLRE